MKQVGIAKFNNMVKFKILENSRLPDVEMTRIVGGGVYCPILRYETSACANNHASCPKDYMSCLEGVGFRSCGKNYEGPKGPAGYTLEN